MIYFGRLPFGAPIAILLMINVGFQLYNFILQNTKPFYYHKVTAVTPEVRPGDFFVQEVDVERFRICKVTVDRFMINKESRDVFFRESVAAGATQLGRNVAINRVRVPFNAPLGEAILIQSVSSHCIEGMHTMPWPTLTFKVVD